MDSLTLATQNIASNHTAASMTIIQGILMIAGAIIALMSRNKK